MKNLNIITYALIPAIFGLSFWLYKSIQAPVERQKEIDLVETAIKAKLKAIEEVQVAYVREYYEYAGSDDALAKFIKSGKITLTEKRDTIFGPSTVNANVDSVGIIIDTIGQVSVMDSIWSKYDYNPDNIGVIPGNPDGKKFEFYTDVIKRKGGKFPVMEIKDVAPIDPRRRTGENPRGALKIGSRNDPITGGNWK